MVTFYNFIVTPMLEEYIFLYIDLCRIKRYHHRKVAKIKDFLLLLFLLEKSI